MNTPPAWCIGDSVTNGRIDHSARNRVVAQLNVLGRSRPIQLELTGNGAPDLCGRVIEFEATAEVTPVPENIDISLDGQLQIGAVGQLTLRHEMSNSRFRTDVHTLAFAQNEHGSSLAFEWFGPSGQVVVEVFEPTVHDVKEAKTFESGIVPTEFPAPLFVFDHLKSTHLELLGLDPRQHDIPQQISDLDPERDDPYGLATVADGVLRADDGSLQSRPLYPLPSIYEFAAKLGEDAAPYDLIRPQLLLPHPDDLGPVETDAALMGTIARLAQHGVQFDICEHATAKQALEFLVDWALEEQDLHLDAAEIPGGYENAVLVVSMRQECLDCERELDEMF
ncbi:MAG: hypothetical protein AAF517_01560 [Planctomycetota bacterium]